MSTHMSSTNQQQDRYITINSKYCNNKINKALSTHPAKILDHKKVMTSSLRSAQAQGVESLLEFVDTPMFFRSSRFLLVICRQRQTPNGSIHPENHFNLKTILLAILARNENPTRTMIISQQELRVHRCTTKQTRTKPTQEAQNITNFRYVLVSRKTRSDRFAWDGVTLHTCAAHNNRPQNNNVDKRRSLMTEKYLINKLREHN